jgi:hypothetical protein
VSLVALREIQAPLIEARAEVNQRNRDLYYADGFLAKIERLLDRAYLASVDAVEEAEQLSEVLL